MICTKRQSRARDRYNEKKKREMEYAICKKCEQRQMRMNEVKKSMNK
jgi:hypothetical protein